jgi:hypothetical protein
MQQHSADRICQIPCITSAAWIESNKMKNRSKFIGSLRFCVTLMALVVAQTCAAAERAPAKVRIAVSSTR